MRRSEVTLLVMTDGRREYITQTIASADEQLLGNITRRVINDDSGDELYRAWLLETFPGWTVLHRGARYGFGGAVQSAWDYLAATIDRRRVDFIFHLEDDFTFPGPVDLDHIAATLRPRDYLVQMALQRQAWNDVERMAGGVIAAMGGDYLEVTDGADACWVEHRRFWTTNPSMYRATLVDRRWPDGLGSEAAFTQQLTRDPDVRFGYWGHAQDPPRAHHIGHTRVGTGYW